MAVVRRVERHAFARATGAEALAQSQPSLAFCLHCLLVSNDASALVTEPVTTTIPPSPRNRRDAPLSSRRRRRRRPRPTPPRARWREKKRTADHYTKLIGRRRGAAPA